jgi:hypothetical protein
MAADITACPATQICRSPDGALTLRVDISGTMVGMTSSSPKLIAMREWAAALKRYDEAQAPYQLRGAALPTPEVARRLEELNSAVDRTYERYQALTWGSADSGAGGDRAQPAVA